MIALHALQIGSHIGRALIADVAILFERLGNQPIEIGGHIRIQLQRSRRSATEDLVRHHTGRRSPERQHAGRHLVEHDAEREQIASRVDPCAAHLLGRHVHHRPQRRSRAGEMRIPGDRRDGGCAGDDRIELGETEVEQLGVSARGDEDVARLDIAMNDAGTVRGVERIGDLECQRQQLVQGHPARDERVLNERPSSRSMAMNG